MHQPWRTSVAQTERLLGLADRTRTMACLPAGKGQWAIRLIVRYKVSTGLMVGSTLCERMQQYQSCRVCPAHASLDSALHIACMP